MNSPRFLVEALSPLQASLATTINEDKKLTMSGIFVQGGVRNLNQRIYPVHEIARAIEDVNKLIQEGYSVVGECDHPEQLTINIDRISHKITNMWMDGPNGMGKLQLVNTPHGNTIRNLIEDGVKLGVSSRGSGNVDDRGNVSDFEIVTVDIVFKPSAPNAYPVPVYEAVQNSGRASLIESLARATVHDPRARLHLKQAMRGVIDQLK
jgi:hypothetical protein